MTKSEKVQILDYGQATHEVIVLDLLFSLSPLC